jgi:hypothetical protein
MRMRRWNLYAALPRASIAHRNAPNQLYRTDLRRATGLPGTMAMLASTAVPV